MADGQRCTVCGKSVNVSYSFRLTKDAEGKWQANPVCRDCRRRLIQQATAEGRFVPFFGLEASQKEANKRNEERVLNRVFLDKFGRPQEKPSKGFQEKPEKSKVVNLSGRR